ASPAVSDAPVPSCADGTATACAALRGKVAHLAPPLLRRHAARGHQDMPMWVPIARAPPWLPDHHIAGLSRALLEPRERIPKHLDPALPQISQQGALRKKGHA